jgi:hypothetical protein
MRPGGIYLHLQGIYLRVQGIYLHPQSICPLPKSSCPRAIAIFLHPEDFAQRRNVFGLQLDAAREALPAERPYPLGFRDRNADRDDRLLETSSL